jgi:hypothetical protein
MKDSTVARGTQRDHGVIVPHYLRYSNLLICGLTPWQLNLGVAYT